MSDAQERSPVNNEDVELEPGAVSALYAEPVIDYGYNTQQATTVVSPSQLSNSSLPPAPELTHRESILLQYSATLVPPWYILHHHI